MRKTKLTATVDLPEAVAAPRAMHLRQSAAGAAQKLFAQQMENRPERRADAAPWDTAKGDGAAQAASAGRLEMARLQQRCAAFGIDATPAELLLAGLYLLGQQTETALEVAVLQSLRADRSFAKRRGPRA